jgi:hypothetical protein
MEYGIEICESVRDDNYNRNVGYKEDNDCIRKYFSTNTLRIISAKITQLLQGVDQENRPIIVPDKTISSVMSEIYNSYRPPTGDIYSRYIIPSGTNSDDYVQNMIDQTIEVITSDVRNNLGMDEINKNLTIWTSVYGDFNRHGLRQVPPIKIRNKHPAHFQFHMRY